MHMSGINYEDFTYFVDFMYEISKRNILEKVKKIYKSFVYFLKKIFGLNNILF